MVIESLPDELPAHERLFHRIMREGLALYHTRFFDLRAVQSLRSQRSDINDCLIEVAKKNLPYVERNNLMLFIVGRYRIKLKKFNVQLETANYPTQGVLNFLDQEQLDLFSGLQLVNLHLGYVPDEFNLRKSTVWMTRPDGASNAWVYELREEGATAVPMTLPATNPNAPAGTKPRVKPKQEPKKKKADGQN